MSTKTYPLDHPAIVHLCKDPLLAQLIQHVGPLEVQLPDDLFVSLVESIIGQQLSLKAASTIIHRVVTHCGTLTPETLDSCSHDDLRKLGVSSAKANSIQGLAREVLQGHLDFLSLSSSTVEEITAKLIKLKGIGPWTIEMFLIFALGHEDVWSMRDITLQRACTYLTKSSTPLSDEQIQTIVNAWAPYRSIAARYCWEGINRNLWK